MKVVNQPVIEKGRHVPGDRKTGLSWMMWCLTMPLW